MVVRTMPYKVSVFGITDVGLVRQNNEDFWGAFPKYNFYILADGMGGHRAGEIAAKEAVSSLSKIIQKLLQPNHNFTLEEAHGLIQLAIEQTNEIVYKKGRAFHELKGMGTTLCCIYFHSKGIIYANVGDSRIYRLRNHKLDQLTKDHSLLRELVDLGQLNEKQATDFLYKNIITKAVGTESSVEPSVHIGDVEDHDIYFMCTDGLSDQVAPEEIEAVLNRITDIKKAAQELVNMAKDKGGYDNITILIAKVQKNKEKNETKDLSR